MVTQWENIFWEKIFLGASYEAIELLFCKIDRVDP